MSFVLSVRVEIFSAKPQVGLSVNLGFPTEDQCRNRPLLAGLRGPSSGSTAAVVSAEPPISRQGVPRRIKTAATNFRVLPVVREAVNLIIF